MLNFRQVGKCIFKNDLIGVEKMTANETIKAIKNICFNCYVCEDCPIYIVHDCVCPIIIRPPRWTKDDIKTLKEICDVVEKVVKENPRLIEDE